MKKFSFPLIPILFCIFLLGCAKEEPSPTGGILMEDTQQDLIFPYNGGQKRIVFTAYESWTLNIPEDAKEWCQFAQTEGGAGSFDPVLSISQNDLDLDRSTVLVLTAGNTRKEIKVLQRMDQVLTVNQNHFVVPIEGGDIEVRVTSNLDYDCNITAVDREWIEPVDVSESGSTRAPKTEILRFHIAAYVGESRREGKITFSNNNIFEDITVSQGKLYESTDYSKNGTVNVHSKAAEGNGINLVFMGDAFSDRQIGDGTYREVMDKGIAAFFAEEPYKSFRNLFNVYSVDVVSMNEGYYTGSKTAFSGFFGTGTLVGGADSVCMRYARMVPTVTSDNIDKMVIVVMMNREYYAGTCYMYYPDHEGDYGLGLSVAYFPLGVSLTEFNGLVSHEAGGHGFAKLCDEYSYESKGRIPSQEQGSLSASARDYGWYKNVDFTNDLQKVKWSRFVSDSRYASEKLNAYEGGATYYKGVYRPTRTSIMVSNQGGFNAPSREAIYYRIHKLAYGDSWTYDYEKFVSYDALNRQAAAQAQARVGVMREREPLHPPVIRGKLPKF